MAGWRMSFDEGQLHNGRAYALDSSEFGAISTVKALLSKGSYHELFSVDNHLLLLESMRKRLVLISAAEASSGLMNWHLRERISEISALVKQLKELRSKLFAAL